MEIDLKTARAVFEDVLSGKLSREKANDWAYSVKKYQDNGELRYIPLTDEDRIWKGIMYLHGVDLLEATGKYLRSEENIRSAMSNLIGLV